MNVEIKLQLTVNVNVRSPSDIVFITRSELELKLVQPKSN